MTNGSDKTAMAMARRLTNQLFTAAAAGKMVPTTPPTPTKKIDTYNTPETWCRRGLAGKPLAGFCTTPSRRITVVYGVTVYAIRFNNPLSHL